MSARLWSTTAGNNNSAPPAGAPEGQSPGSLNNVIRQVMADARDTFEQLPFFDFGHTPTRVDNDTFTVSASSPTDLTSVYAANRRVKLVGATTGYGTITSSSYSAPDTTVNLVMDSGNVPTSLSTASLGPDSNGAVTSSALIHYDRTAAEIAASVTPQRFEYIAGDTGPGDIRRYPGPGDVTNSSSASVVAAAVQWALASHGYAFIPYGDTGLWNWGEVLLTGERQKIVFATNTIATYAGTGRAIDFDGYRGGEIHHMFMRATAAATHAVRIGPDGGSTRFAHRWRIYNCKVFGSDPGEGSGTINSTLNAFEVERAFYGKSRDSEAAYCNKGFYGFNQHNGNDYTDCVTRECNYGVHWDGTSASNGNTWKGGNIESSKASVVAGIYLGDTNSDIFSAVRMELTTGGTHIIVSPPTDVCQYASLVDVQMEGTRPAYAIGGASGSDVVKSLEIVRGRSAGSWIIGANCTQLRHITGDAVRHAALVPGSGLLTDNGVRTNIDLSGSLAFTGTLTGCTTSPTAGFSYSRYGRRVFIEVPTLVATSNTTACTITGMPAEIRPTTTRNRPVRVYDNSAAVSGMASIATSGVITLSNSLANSGSMTNGNDKGIMSGFIEFDL